MDETTAPSTSSTSAAAVADSASAAASSKIAAANATSVKLLIKASNQQFDDQIIDSDLLWTVKRLKTQLSLVYPSKPPVADQKLIYSGQLLSDNVQLKDVIRIYKDVYTQNHIFHLVYTPKQAPPSAYLKQKPKMATVSPSTATTMTNSPDGLRQRQVAGGMQQQPAQQLPQVPQQQSVPQYMHQSQQFVPQMLSAAQSVHCPQYDPNNPLQQTMPFSLPGQFNMQALATHQAAMYNWMQQVYSQYMDQCIRLANTTAGLNANLPTTNATAGTSAVGDMSAHSYFRQQMPFGNLNAAAGPAPLHPPVIPYASRTGAAASFVAQQQLQANLVQAQVQAPIVPQFVQPEAAAAAAAVRSEPAVAEQQQPAQPQPRFPNIVQEEPENRDWLDSFFSITRLAIFMTILYFNSSPLRCLIVVIIAGGIYLYHIGVIRVRRERNNNNINRNHNADADQIRQGVQQVQRAQAAQQQQQQGEDAARAADDANADAADDAPLLGNEATINTEADATDDGDDEDSDPFSVLSFVRTFVVTFFTSLLPETPAL